MICARVRPRDRAAQAALLPRQPAGTGAGCDRLPGLLLPLPRHEDRPPRLAVRAVDDRLGLPLRRDAHLCRLLRRRRPRKRRRSAGWPTNSTAGRTGSGRSTAAPAVSHGWRPETGFIPHTWTGYDEALLVYLLGLGSPTLPAAGRELRRLLLDLPVEADLRARGPLLRAAVHAPALAPLDRFPRHPGRVHARARKRLLREQPPGDLRPPGVCAAQPARVRRLRRALLGHHGERWPGLGRRGA